MKDYSKYIPSSYGFITKYEIVGDEIHIYTPETKKGEPHKYPATQEYINYFEIRMETQYQLIVENQDILKKQLVTIPTQKTWKVTAVAIIALCIPTYILLALTTYGASIPLLGAILLPICVNLKVKKTKKNFEEEMDIIKTYLYSRKEIEKLNEQDKNITEYLSKDAKKRLEFSKTLKENESLDTIFSIDFMDKSKLKDIKNILSRYLISKSIHEKQSFIEPNEEEKRRIFQRKQR